MAEAAQEPSWLLQAYQAHGTSAGLGGRFTEGLASLDAVIAMAGRGSGEPGMMARLRDPLVLAHCYRAYCSWFLDDDDGSRADEAKALALAAEGHPITRCAALATMAVMNRLRDHHEVAERLAREAIALAKRIQNPFWEMTASTVVAWLPLARGEPEQALHALRSWQARHLGSDIVPVTTTLVQSDLADALIRLERWDEVEEALGQAREGLRSRLSFGWGSEVERMAAAMHAKRGELPMAREAARLALTIARDYRSPTLERRARAIVDRLGTVEGPGVLEELGA
jgi:hypothetical protein